MGRGRRVVPESSVTWDDAFDVVVVGAGAGGFPAALNAARLGSSAVILEKAAEPGGTMKKSAAWYWIPNNTHMREDGKDDPKDGFLRYVARLSRPQAYHPDAERYGLSEWEYETVSVLYDNASVANDTLAEMGAIAPLYSPGIPDYHSTIPEASAPYGRTLQIDRGDGEMGKGDVLTAQLMAACEANGVPVRMGHRVTGVVVDDDGAVVGVRADANGRTVHVGARQAVIFASGGFTHDETLRKNFLAPVIVSGCAAPSNEGDFVHIATALGVPLRNMNFAWMAPIPFELAVRKEPQMSGIFAVPGDSMIWVDKRGNRVVNEKTIYNELAMSFLEWDSEKLEYPRMLMFMIWDERTKEKWAPDPGDQAPGPHLQLANYGNVVYDDYHLIKGDTLDGLAASIEDRLASLSVQSGGFTLDPSFRENLARSVARYNELAPTGRDDDLHRGENPIELIFNGPAKDDNDSGNPTMYPISESGPYYATIICAGTLDTKGGPVTNANGQVLDTDGEPVPGLYAVGNCAANASAQAYWAGGGTIGPYFTFGYLAGSHAAGSPRREAAAV